MKTASPSFMYLLLAGSVLMYASIYPLLPDASSAACTANVWLAVLGFFLAFSAVFMKTYRYVSHASHLCHRAGRQTRTVLSESTWCSTASSGG